MKLYFSRITADHWTAKNKLEAAAKELAKEMDRRIINEAEIPDFKRDFLAKIDELDRQFNKYKPLRFSIKKQEYSNGDYWIYCDGVFNMSLFLVKE